MALVGRAWRARAWAGAARLGCVAAAAALLLAAIAPGAGAAQESAGESELAIEAAWGGSYAVGRPFPVRVSVRADRLVDGTLSIRVHSDAGEGVPVELPVEVPGGTTKAYRVTVTPPFAAFDPTGDAQVQVELRDGGRRLAEASARISAPLEVELVGLLPGALDGREAPAAAPLALDAGTARFFALGDADLEDGPRGLASLGTIAASPTDLARLPARDRETVLRWAQDGGRLLVDASDGAAVDGLPDALRPGPSGRAAIGAGEVALARGAIAEGRWAGLVEPTATTGATFSRMGMGHFGEPLSGAVAEQAGLRVPELGALMAALAAYVVLAGPVLFFVLRRSRRLELAWLFLPALAVTFTIGSYAAGRGLRTGVTAGHGTVVVTGPVGATARSTVGVAARTGSGTEVVAPSGWTAHLPADLPGVRDGGDGVHLAPRGDSVVARLELAGGEFGVVELQGAMAAPPSLEVSAIANPDGTVGGTVANRSGRALDRVEVMAPYDSARIGRLQPGEERPFTLDLRGKGGGEMLERWRFQRFGHRFDDGEPFGPDRGDADSRTDDALFESLLSSAGTPLVKPGWITAAGGSSAVRPPLTVRGEEVRRGRTLVVSTARITSAAPVGPEVAVAVVGAGAGQGRAIVRFTLPEGATPASYTLRALAKPVEVWDGSSWQSTLAPAAPGDGAGGAPAPPVVGEVMPVPAGGQMPQTVRRLPGGGVEIQVDGQLPIDVERRAPVDVTLPAGALRDGALFVRMPVMSESVLTQAWLVAAGS